MKYKNMYSWAMVITFVSFFALECRADAGVPMIFLGFPFMWLTLIPVIFIEVLVYRKHINKDLKQIAIPVTVANVVTTLVGYPLAWALLFGIEFATTGGGSAFGLETTMGKFIAVTLQSAWLVPYETDLYWMIPLAGLVGLVPTYFISVYMEAWVLKKFWKDNSDIRKLSWIANRNSYVLLIVIILLTLVYNILKNKP